uniref:Uncharacterized protein n=1 Tax=Chelydra serpentina TaxID=8475 RepID=A0A8C3SNK1_CHESE
IQKGNSFLLLIKWMKSLYHASLPVEQSEQKEFRASEENEWKFPPQFINEIKAFKSTQDVVQLQLSQKENANVAIQEILQEIFTIFSKNLTQTAWDSSSIARFQNGLHQQIQRLEVCLAWKVRTSNAFLRDRQYSPCAWAIIHGSGAKIGDWSCFEQGVELDDLLRSLPTLIFYDSMKTFAYSN